MSLKYHAQKIGSHHYLLPRIGTMRTDAHAFFSEALFEATEESMWQQLAAGASYEGVIGAYLMPDAHSGYGVPVGHVYKDLDEVLGVLEAEGIAKVAHRLYPLANLEGID